MSDALPVADVTASTVTLGDTTYAVRALSEDTFTLLLAGVPVARLVYSFGAANGVPEGDALTEEAATTIAEVWFAAVDA